MADPHYFDHRQINKWRDESKRVKLLTEGNAELPETLREFKPALDGWGLTEDGRVAFRLAVGSDPVSHWYFTAVEHFVAHMPIGQTVQRGMKREDFVKVLEQLDDIPVGMGTEGLAVKEAAALYQRIGNIAAIEEVALTMQRDTVKLYRALREMVLSCQQNGGTPAAKVVVNAARALREVSEDG